MTKLDKPLRRELEIGSKLYTLALDRHGLKLTPKGHRKGVEVPWPALLRGELREEPLSRMVPVPPSA